LTREAAQQLIMGDALLPKQEHTSNLPMSLFIVGCMSKQATLRVIPCYQTFRCPNPETPSLQVALALFTSVCFYHIIQVLFSLSNASQDAENAPLHI
jgi:hypothetical protein